MKKITVIFSILFLTFTGTAFAQERVQFDKAAAKKFKSILNGFTVFLSGEVVLTHEKFDTSYVEKNGRPFEIIKDNSTVIKIRYKEAGKIEGGMTSDTLRVSFDSKDKQSFTLPFRVSAGGPGNDNNTIIIRMDRKPIFQIDGSVAGEEETNHVTIAGKKYTVSDNSVYLEYEPVFKTKESKTKKVSRGNPAK